MEVTFLKEDQTEKVMNWTMDSFLEDMNALPLAEALSKAEELELCSPTISIIKEGKNRVLWRSIISDVKDSFEFVVGLVEGDDKYDFGEVSFERFLELAKDYMEGNEIEGGTLVLKPKKQCLFSRIFGF